MNSVAELEAANWLERAESALEKLLLEQSVECFNEAERLGAQADRCCGGRWMAAMLAGRYEAAWRESDALRRRGSDDPNRYWMGEDIRDARVIVRSLHGFGDAVQMLRYAPLLRQVCASVVFEVAPRFVGLARWFRRVEEVITWGDAAPQVPAPWDVQLEVMELPYLFRTALKDLPLAREYLELPGSMVLAAGVAMGERRRPRVGVVWAGGDWNRGRSIPFSLMHRLLQVGEVEFWNLQGGTASDDCTDSDLREVPALFGDGIVDLACTIANLDLVITVDTLAAHLAGALGRPAWVMLEHAADWRWMTAREDSPWYPTLRLFRQSHAGDWHGLVADVMEALSRFCLPVESKLG